MIFNRKQKKVKFYSVFKKSVDKSVDISNSAVYTDKKSKFYDRTKGINQTKHEGLETARPTQ